MATGQSKGVRRVPELLRLERLLWDLGYVRVAGVDEVGLGPLAGPVVAAAVIFPVDPPALALRDSKRLSPKQREELDLEIRVQASAVGIGAVEVTELDRLGVYHAGLEAMRRAVIALDPPADYLLVDARTVPAVGVGQSAFTKADTFVYSVAASSIVAKVFRDALMRDLEDRYPGYGFARHMGYGTREHLAALERLGACAVHRRSFAPVKRALGA